MNVTVVSQTHDAETDQGTHVQREDWDEQRLHTLQVTVEENGHENNLQETRRDDKQPTITHTHTPQKLKSRPDSHYLGYNVRDRGRAHDDAVLVLEKNPGMNPRLQTEQWTEGDLKNKQTKTPFHSIFLNHSWTCSNQRIKTHLFLGQGCLNLLHVKMSHVE